MKHFWKSLAAGVALGAILSAPLAAAPANPVQNQPAFGGPVGIGPNYNALLGSYAKGMTSGVIAAGASAGAPIFDFQYTGPGLAVIRKVTISVGDAGTGFAAGNAHFDLYAARAFTAADTGGTAGTLTGNNAKLRTSFPTTALGAIMIANTGAMSAGTRTLDTDPLGSVSAATTTTAGLAVLAPTDLLAPKNAGDYPAVFATNEGFEIQATVPATGTWTVSVTVYWDEYSSY